MQLEEYFDFVSPAEIQIRGHRIWMEHILYEYIHNAMTPQELAERFPTLNLEKIYAALLYYHRNQEAMDRYLAEWIEHGERMWQEQQQNPTPGMLRLRKLREEREAQAKQAVRPELA